MRLSGKNAKMLFGITCAFSVVSLWLALYRSLPSSNKISVIVFKLPRSGSAWFTELLNDIPEYYISKEIVQSSDVGRFSQSIVESHLTNALLNPTGKLDALSLQYNWMLNWFWLRSSGRMVEDYYLHRTLKPFRDQDVVGFTLNPEHCPDVDWTNVIQAVSAADPHRRIRVMLLTRSNIPKTVVSGYLGAQMKAVCGSSNMKRARSGFLGSASSPCSFPLTVDVNVTTFIRDIQRRQARQQTLLSYIASRQSLSGLPLLHVHYEDLQSRPATVIQDVRQFLTRTAESAAIAVPSPPQHPDIAQSSRWVKRSSERLATVLQSFSVLHKVLSAYPQCSGLLQQLVEEGQRVFAYGGDVDECCRRVLQHADEPP